MLNTTFARLSHLRNSSLYLLTTFICFFTLLFFILFQISGYFSSKIPYKLCLCSQIFNFFSDDTHGIPISYPDLEVSPKVLPVTTKDLSPHILMHQLYKYLLWGLEGNTIKILLYPQKISIKKGRFANYNNPMCKYFTSGLNQTYVRTEKQ